MYSLSKRDTAGAFQVFASGLSHKHVANLLPEDVLTALRGEGWPAYSKHYIARVDL